MSYPDLTNVIFFPEPTLDQLQYQRQRVEDLLEEAHIDYDLNGFPEDLSRIEVLTARSSDLYEKAVNISRENILSFLNSA